MLKIKQSQVMLSAIHGVGSAALLLFLLEITARLSFLTPSWAVALSYFVATIFFALGVWVLIVIQGEHENKYGYLDIVLFVLNLWWIALGIHWAIAIALFFAFVVIGFRYDPVKPQETYKPVSKRAKK